MSIEDFLQEHSDKVQKATEAKAAQQKMNQDAEEKFKNDAKACFLLEVLPFIQDMAKTFSKPGWTFTQTQEVYRISYSGPEQRSFTVSYGQRKLQMDISTSFRKYEINFNAKTENGGTKNSEKYDSITKESLTKIFEKKLKEIFS